MAWCEGRGGWFAYLDTNVIPTPVFVRVREDGERLAIAAVLLEDPDEALTSTRLRQVPLGRIEGAVAGSAEVLRARLHDTDGDPLAELRAVMADIARARPAAQPSTKMKPLGRPPAAGGGDEFYSRVAFAYMALAAVSRSPAADLAKQSDVPVGTVHRWIREARRRGLLSAGRKGKVG